MSAPTRAEEKLLRGLARRKTREAEGLFVAEGVRVVEELLAARLVPRLALISSILEDTDRGRALAASLEATGVAKRVAPHALAGVAGTRASQGVIVAAEIPRRRLADIDLGAGVAVGATAPLLVLDGVQDPGNVGTLARTAAAFGCRGLLCLTGTVDPWNPKAVRASAGALFRMPVVTPDTEQAAEWLGGQRVSLLGADAAGSPIEEVARAERTALVVGNEGAGLGDAMRARCSALVAVPMPGGTESLNVAVAAGILLYEITRGRA